MGLASVALHPLADDLLFWRQPAGKIRGCQRILRNLLLQTKTAGGLFYGVRQGGREAADARLAGIGGGDSRPVGSDLRLSLEGGRLTAARWADEGHNFLLACVVGQQISEPHLQCLDAFGIVRP